MSTPSQTSSLLDVRGLTVDFGSTRAVDDVSFALHPGRVLAIVGESGSGKSQLSRALTGLSPGTVTGSVRLEGRELVGMPERQSRAVRGPRVAYVFQDPMASLNPYLRIGTQLAEVARTHLDLSASEADARAIDRLRDVRLPDPADRVRAFPYALSGGQRQRAVIAMALMADPAVLIADEPTTALDFTVQRGILDLLRGLCTTRGLAILLITHDMGVAAHAADEMLVMRHGRIVERGPTSKVLQAPTHGYTRRLLADTPDLAAVAASRPLGSQADDPPLLEARDLRVAYPVGGPLRRRTVEAVRGVSLSLRRGESLGVVGESGSGKSTLVRALMRLTPSTSGTVLWNGEPIDGFASAAPLRRDVRMVFQDPHGSLNPRMRVGALIGESLLANGVPAAEHAGRVAWALDAVGLDVGLINRHPHALSGGQAQRVAIARAIVSRPKLLICDEAVSALDVTVQARMLALLDELRSKLDLALLFITHDLAVVRNVADRILVMKDGRAVEVADRDTLFERPAHPYTRDLLAAALPLPSR